MMQMPRVKVPSDGDFIVFDLDGCISDDRYRRKLLPVAPEGECLNTAYDHYNAHLQDDSAANRSVVEGAIQALKSSGGKILFITARPEKFAKVTCAWITRQFNIPSWSLYMRANGDLRKSPELKTELLHTALLDHGATLSRVICAYDDRQDVLDAYVAMGVEQVIRMTVENGVESIYFAAQKEEEPELTKEDKRNAADILQVMADTYRERNKIYGDNYKSVGAVMTAMFPKGVVLKTPADYNKWHLFELMVVKMTRFANSNLTHQDSIHDAAVYAAMVESLLPTEKSNG